MKRVAVCGFGFMGQNHTANIFRCKELELAAVVDATPKSEIKPVKGNVATDAFDWEKLNGIPFYSSLPEALDRTGADAVLIATPTRFHVPLALEAVAHGKHVFVEKPLCFSLEDGEALKKAMAGKDLVFQVGHCVRFKNEYRILREACANQRYGKLKYLKLYRLTGTPNWGAWKNLDKSISSASGPIFDLCIHDIDYALSLMGEPESVSARKAGYADSVFSAELNFSGGCRIEVEGGFMLPSPLPFRTGFFAVFEHAAMEYDSRLGDKITLSTDQESRVVDTSMKETIYQAELAEFVSAITKGTPVQCGLEDGFKAIKLSHCLKDILTAK